MAVYLFRTVKVSIIGDPRYSSAKPTPSPFFDSALWKHSNEYLLELDNPTLQDLNYFASTLVHAERHIQGVAHLFVSIFAVSETVPIDLDSPYYVVFPQAEQWNPSDPDGRAFVTMRTAHQDLDDSIYYRDGERFVCYPDTIRGLNIPRGTGSTAFDAFFSVQIKFMRSQGAPKKLTYFSAVAAEDCVLSSAGTLQLCSSGNLVRFNFARWKSVFKYITPFMANAEFDSETRTIKRVDGWFLKPRLQGVSNNIARRRAYALSLRSGRLFGAMLAEVSYQGRLLMNALFNQSARYSYNSLVSFPNVDILLALDRYWVRAAQVLRQLTVGNAPVADFDPDRLQVLSEGSYDKSNPVSPGYLPGRMELLCSYIDQNHRDIYYLKDFKARNGNSIGPGFWDVFQASIDDARKNLRFGVIDNLFAMQVYAAHYELDYPVYMERFSLYLNQLAKLEKFFQLKPVVPLKVTKKPQGFYSRSAEVATTPVNFNRRGGESLEAFAARKEVARRELWRIFMAPVDNPVPSTLNVPMNRFVWFGPIRWIKKKIFFAGRLRAMGPHYSLQRPPDQPGTRPNSNPLGVIPYDPTIHPLTNEEADEEAVSFLEEVEERAKIGLPAAYTLLEFLSRATPVQLPPTWVVSPFLLVAAEDINPNDEPNIEFKLPKQLPGWENQTLLPPGASA